MDWLSHPKGILGAHVYSANFNYPLTPHEAWFWQVGTNLPKPKKNTKVNRLRREKISQQKLKYLSSVIRYLTSNPFILAIFVTGSLAMNNCVLNDDIDLMLITNHNSLWLARLWNVLVLTQKNLRRPPSLPEHNSFRVNNKLCDNLYLEDLHISQKNLYIAHEVLQAKPVYDPNGLQRQFLLQNSWVKKYLPVAYRETLKNIPQIKSFPETGFLDSRILGFLNLIAFLAQYLYMRPRITTERVSLTQAFFHPRKTVL